MTRQSRNDRLPEVLGLRSKIKVLCVALVVSVAYMAPETGVSGTPGNSAILTVLVSLQSSSPTIGCAPFPLWASCMEGDALTSLSLAVWNASPPGTLNYTVASTPTWVSCIPTSGSSAGQVTTHTVFVDPSVLNAGDYSGTITITAAGASNSPRRIPVTIHVGNVLPTVWIDRIAPNPAHPPSDMIVFSGTARDIVGSITRVEWRSSLDGVLSDATSFTKSSYGMTVGNHTITMTAWDDDGSSSSQGAALTVLNALPTAKIGAMVPNPVDAGATVTLTLAGSDNDERGFSVVGGELTWPDGVHANVLPGTRQISAPARGGNYVILYRVRDDEGQWSKASSASLTVLLVSAPVLSVEPAFTQGLSNQVAWSAIPGASGYYLQWSATATFLPVTGSTGWIMSTTQLATGLSDRQTYYYRVKCRNSALAESEWSNVVSSRQDASGPTVPGIPAAGGAFSSSTTVRFSWTASADDVSGVATYGLLIDTFPGGRIFNGMVGNVLSKSVTGANGRRLYAQVYARDTVGNISAWSPVSVGVLIDTLGPTAPGTPTDRGAFTSSTAVRFDWTAANDKGTSGSGVVSYEVWVGTAPGSGDRFQGNVGDVLTRTVVGANGQRLYARVRARDRAGNHGSWSGNSDGITIDTVSPRLIAAVASGGSAVEVTFDEPVENAASILSYTLTGGLGLVGVVRIDDSQYLILTTRQTPDSTYTVTVQDIVHDRAGNPVNPSARVRAFSGSKWTGARSWTEYR